MPLTSCASRRCTATTRRYPEAVSDEVGNGRASGSCKGRAMCGHSSHGIAQGHGVSRTRVGGVSTEWHKVQTMASTSVVVVLDHARMSVVLKCVVATVSSPRWWCCAGACAAACKGMAVRHRVQTHVRDGALAARRPCGLWRGHAVRARWCRGGATGSSSGVRMAAVEPAARNCAVVSKPWLHAPGSRVFMMGSPHTWPWP